MQYVGKVGGYVYNQWNSLNPATLSGAIDVIVIEHPDGTLHTSPWHIRFGKFQIIKPSQKKIDLYVNDIKTNLPMKLGDGGEAHFVFEVDDKNHALSHSVLTSPIISPVSSPGSSPVSTAAEPLDDLDLNENTNKLNIPTKFDLNGDLVIDLDGYKPNSQKNIENSDELFQKIFFEEIEGEYSQGEKIKAWEQFISRDENGHYRISNTGEFEGSEMEDDSTAPTTLTTATTTSLNTFSTTSSDSDKTYFKTLRLTSDQLSKMNLHYGENSLKFKASDGNSQVTANLYLWKSTTPIVISDIDGTITKSDALGHVLNLIGRDWTHPGLLADTTRQYLQGVNQDGIKLPPGPVILSPDRTFAALRREVVLKKPEVFKMACLSDIKNLFFEPIEGNEDDNDDDHTPFYAGFGNRITDAISYRSVHIPSHRIFTINPNGEVHMELLELAGYKSSYLHIGELVDQFFPPIRQVSSISSSPGSPRSVMEDFKTDEKFNDVNYWREPLDLDNLTDSDDDVQGLKQAVSEKNDISVKKNEKLSHGLILNQEKEHNNNPELLEKSRSRASTIERPTSGSSFTSPLKSFMMFGKKKDNSKDDDSDYGNEQLADGKLTEEDMEVDDVDIDEEDDDDYTDDDYDEDDYDEDEDDDYEDEEDDEEDDYDDYDDDEEIDEIIVPDSPLLDIDEDNKSGSNSKELSAEDVEKLRI
ncbi:LNS2 (Lipin/Ned1/Smp2) family protein [Candida albicans]|uniref:LNS2 (Lipin/Ned1/Smp2) family protein n=1 Tax=Candida albicans TaxID=5476 RepID=A0A8H6BXJ6_CANAX|nr:LNS2 (Lipin/Ned1/Smp2) family protein [Candida albicans]